jgi:hypothetical protein
MSIEMPSVMSYHGVLADRPAKAEPLFCATEANAYMTSVRPCMPGLRMLLVPGPMTRDIPPRTRTVIGMTSTYATTSFIWGARIFLPRNSGVRPTMRPAMNTDSSASTRMLYSPPPSPPGLISPSRIATNAPVPPTGV